MFSIKSILIILIILTIVNLYFIKVYAQDGGCLIGNKVYYETPVGVNDKFFQGNSFYLDYANCNGNSGQYYTITNIDGRNCFADYKGSGNIKNKDNYNLGPGDRVEFNLYNCPIDDYIPLMLWSAGGIGVFFLRRNKFVYISNGNT